MTDLLAGKSVLLQGDDTQDDRDRYGRLLRYVFLPGGININELLVENGFAHEYTYDNPYLYQGLFTSWINGSHADRLSDQGKHQQQGRQDLSPAW